MNSVVPSPTIKPPTYSKVSSYPQNSFGASTLHQEISIKNSEFHLTLREIGIIIDSTKSLRDKCLIKTLAHTGLRRFELASIRVEDVNFDQKLLHVPRGKGQKSRIVPLTKKLTGDLKRLANGSEEGFLFISRRGRRISLRQINEIVAKTGRKSGIKNPNPKYHNITPHLFRHSFSRLWKEKGGSIESLSKILGHTSVKSTWDQYGTEDLKTVQENYEKIMEEEDEE